MHLTDPAQEVTRMFKKKRPPYRISALVLALVLALSSSALAAENELPSEGTVSEEGLPQLPDPEQNAASIEEQTPAVSASSATTQETPAGGHTGDPVSEEEPGPDAPPVPDPEDDPETLPDPDNPENVLEPGLSDLPGDPDDPEDPAEPSLPDQPSPPDGLTGDDAFSWSEEELSLSYDDRLAIASRWEGLSFLEVRDEEVTSMQVEKGLVTEQTDAHVLVTTDSDKKLRAAGTGSCSLILVSPEDLADARMILEGAYLVPPAGEDPDTPAEPETAERPDDTEEADGGIPAAQEPSGEEEAPEDTPDDPPAAPAFQTVERSGPIPATRVSVSVKPASLSVLYLLGQSNMEGHSPDSSSYMGKDSVVCEEGVVYSTYVPAFSAFSKIVSGISQSGYMQGASALDFVAESLASDRSMTGTGLKYPLNQLTAARSGKSGMDGALAWKWNKLTGDKVWVSNLAAGSTYISDWTSQGAYFKKILPAMKALRQVAEAEQKAGHYRLHYRLSFWMQGEFDSMKKSTSFDNYLASFKKMYFSMQPALGFSRMGVITTRYSKDKNYTNAKDMVLDGPRRAQYYVGWNSTEYRDVYLVSNINEQWTSDSAVQKYYSSTYGGGRFTYPLRNSASLKANPGKVTQLHSSIHYAQAGHNENGISAAQGMYDAVTGAAASSSYKLGAWFRSKSGGSVNTVSGDSYSKPAVWIGTWKTAALGRIQFKGSGITYNPKTGQITFSQPKNTYLTARDSASGKTLATLRVNFDGIWLNGSKVYYYKTGTMKKGWQTVSGRKYYFKTNGQAALGFQKIGKKKYYFFPTGTSSHRIGTMATGWQTIGGKKYYFYSSGAMATGRVKIGKKYYTFKSNGQLKK